MADYVLENGSVKGVNDIGIDYLRDCFEYRDGKLYWKKRPEEHFADRFAYAKWTGRSVGKEAGSNDGKEYRSIRLTANGVRYRLKRSHVVLAIHGILVPQGMFVDHRNGIPYDDHFENLRIITHADNQLNRKVAKNSPVGIKGVRPQGDKWAASISYRRKTFHLGTFPTKEEAADARLKKEIELYGEFRRKDEKEPPKPLDPFPYEPTPEEEAWLNSIGSL